VRKEENGGSWLEIGRLDLAHDEAIELELCRHPLGNARRLVRPWWLILPVACRQR
jgi:hypothetical protein